MFWTERLGFDEVVEIVGHKGVLDTDSMESQVLPPMEVVGSVALSGSCGGRQTLTKDVWIETEMLGHWHFAYTKQQRFGCPSLWYKACVHEDG